VSDPRSNSKDVDRYLREVLGDLFREPLEAIQEQRGHVDSAVLTLGKVQGQVSSLSEDTRTLSQRIREELAPGLETALRNGSEIAQSVKDLATDLSLIQESVAENGQRLQVLTDLLRAQGEQVAAQSLALTQVAETQQRLGEALERSSGAALESAEHGWEVARTGAQQSEAKLISRVTSVGVLLALAIVLSAVILTVLVLTH